MLDDDNFYVRAKAEGRNLPAFLDQALNRELHSLEELSRVTPEQASAFQLHPGLFPTTWQPSGVPATAYTGSMVFSTTDRMA